MVYVGNTILHRQNKMLPSLDLKQILINLIHMLMLTYGPEHEILVLIAYATGESFRIKPEFSILRLTFNGNAQNAELRRL